jgi:pilus assembly protein FimV
MRSLARWSSLPLLAVPLSSWALSLGEIEADSYLNQPLKAEIPFSATATELATLSVSMAPVGDFLANGLEYPSYLNSIEFSVGQNADGQSVIIVSSSQPIAEPFVTMRVNVKHARGGFTREYSVFLDPPLFRDDNAPSQPIAAPVTRDSAPSVARAPIERAAPAPAPARQPVQQPAPQAQRTPPAPPPAQPAPITGDYTVQAGDTLWAIARRNRPAGVTTNQAMLSIFNANPGAFNANINVLRRGAILRMPPAAQFGGVAAAAATAEVQRQIDAWRNQIDASPQLVLLPPSESAADGGGAAADAASSARVDALENQVSDLQTQLGSTEAELAEARRLLDIRDEALSNLQQQLDSANNAASNPAAANAAPEDVESEQLFVDENEAETTAAGSEPAQETPAEAPAPTPAVTPAAAPADNGPSLVDRVLGLVTNPIVAIGGGVLVVLLAALAFLRRRREDVDDVTGQWDALEAELDEDADLTATARIRAKSAEPDMVVVEGLPPGEETAEERQLGGTAEIEALGSEADFDFGDTGTAQVESLLEPEEFTGAEDEAEAQSAPELAEPTISSQTLSSQTVINLDQADPIAEADFHMAYGLYDQAADLISKALAADPDNRAFKLKLLEVYFVWGNKEQFLESAKSLHADGTGADWDKVVIMGKQICPDEPLFAGATAAAGEVDLDLEGSGSSAGLDFPFEDAESEDVDLDLDLVEEEADLSLAQSGARAVSGGSRGGSAGDMLDIGAQTQAGLEAALFEDTDDDGEKTTPGGEIGDLDVTMESPTVSTETRGLGGEMTLESPTVESIGPDAPTVETPTIETPAAEEAGDTVEHVQPAAAGASDRTTEMTAEIEIDDLALDIGDLEGLPHDLGDLSVDSRDGDTAEQRGIEVEEGEAEVDQDQDMLSATGVTQVLDDRDIEHTGTAIIGDEDATMMAPGFDSDDLDSTGTSTAVLEQSVSSYDPEPLETEDDLDLNLDDFSSALVGGETVEQPMASRFGNDLDLDIGTNPVADDEPTGTEEVALDPQTMTEVGTKLDLARAYIDMGDPDGAKSILEEVLSEGDAGQRSEAQALIDALPA